MSTDVDERFSFISDNITSILRISKLSDQYHKLQSILNNSNEIVTFLDDSK